jgi:ribosome-associated protein
VDAHELINRAIAIVYDKKGEHVRVLNVADNLSITDYFVLVSAKNRRQAQAICSAIDIEMKGLGVPKARIEGAQAAWWALLDFDQVVIHVFQEQAREYYDLDQLWADAADLTEQFAPDTSGSDVAPA